MLCVVFNLQEELKFKLREVYEIRYKVFILGVISNY